MTDMNLVLAWLMGFFGGVHCLAMCGSIIAALSFSLPPEIRQQRKPLWRFIVVYNAGRLLSYTLAGGLMGALGHALAVQVQWVDGHFWLTLLSSLILASTGLYLGQWWPKFAALERVGLPLWRRLEPVAQSLLPVKNLRQAFVLGTVWGWLPCSMVYIALFWASSQGDAWQAAGLMLAFGLGTLPAMLSAGLFSFYLLQAAQSLYLRQRVGLLLILMAAINLIIQGGTTK